MDYYLDVCLPPLVVLALSVLLSLIVGGVLHFFYGPSKEAAQPTGLPAGPGNSLLAQLDGFNAAMLTTTVQIIILPLLLYGAYMHFLYFFPDKIHWSGIAILGAGGIGYEINRFIKLRAIRAMDRVARLAYENKTATAQALIPLMHAGYAVFHEVRCNDRVIDHVIIGPKGIFAMQTYTHPRWPDPDPSKNIVGYDGRTLLFGEENAYTAIEATEQLVEQLSAWLSVPLPEAIAIRPILVVPGWAVKRTSVDGMPVVNLKQFDSLFQHIGPRPLEPATIKIIYERIVQSYCQGAANAGAGPETKPAVAPAVN